MDHLVSLTVGTIGPDDHAQVYQDISELASNLTEAHAYVSVSSQLVEIDDQPTEDGNDCPKEHLYYDDQTIAKARDAFIKVLNPVGMIYDSPDVLANGLINALLNANLLIRERAV